MPPKRNAAPSPQRPAAAAARSDRPAGQRLDEPLLPPPRRTALAAGSAQLPQVPPQQQRSTPASLRRDRPATLSGTLTTTETATIIDDIVNNRIKILFVSPEKLCSSSFKRLLNKKWDAEKKMMIRLLPPVSILCVDEAHCLSQVRIMMAHGYRRNELKCEMLHPLLLLN